MARQIKERMGNTTVNNKPTVQVGQGQGVQSGSAGGCCYHGHLSKLDAGFQPSQAADRWAN